MLPRTSLMFSFLFFAISSNSCEDLVEAIRNENAKKLNAAMKAATETTVNKANEEGFYPLQIAIALGKDKIAKKLIEKGARADLEWCQRSLLHVAAEKNLKTAAVALVEICGVNVCTNDLDYCTPLHAAAQSGSDDVLKYLLSKGSCKEAKNRYGHTPLMEAVRYGTSQVVQTLLENDCDVFARDFSENTVLHHASPSVKPGIMELLLQWKAEVNVVNYKGITPLQIFLMFETEAKVRALIEAGADLEARDNNLSTPIAYAAIRSDNTFVELLLAKGVDPNVRNISGKSPLKSAEEHGHRSVLCSLIEGGADIPSDCDILLRNFWHPCYKISSEKYGDFDEYFLAILETHVKSMKLDVRGKKLKELLGIYNDHEVFTLYRILNNLHANLQLKAGGIDDNEAILAVPKRRTLEEMKDYIFDISAYKIFKNTYVSTLPKIIIRDLTFCSGFLGWNMERNSWNLAVASRVLNANFHEIKSFLAEMIYKKEFGKKNALRKILNCLPVLKS